MCKVTMMEEERTIPKIAGILPKIAGILEARKDTWYKTEEAVTTYYTYSKVDLSQIVKSKDAKKALLIGLNPRSAYKNDTRTIKDEYGDYCEYKQRNAAAKHREHIGNALEPTRSNVIKDLFGRGKIVKSLVTVDLFSKRTHDSNELIREIKRANNIDDVIVKDNLQNLQNIKKEIKNADVVVVAWGNVDESLWSSIGQYRDDILNLLKEKQCYWYGGNDNGSPKHPVARGKKSLDIIDDWGDLEKALGK